MGAMLLPVEQVLLREEGFRREPYLCSEGYVTIGYGTKIHNLKGQDPADFPIRFNVEVAREFLRGELALINLRLGRKAIAGIYEMLVDEFPNRATIIQSMCYQMGVRGVVKFHNMWAALALKDWDRAAAEMLDSGWARQTPERADRHASCMRSGILSTQYAIQY